MINYNLDMVSLQKVRQQEGGGGGQGADAARRIDLGRSLQLWLSLQNALNSLYDSTAADKTSAGIQAQAFIGLLHVCDWFSSLYDPLPGCKKEEYWNRINI